MSEIEGVRARGQRKTRKYIISMNEVNNKRKKWRKRGQNDVEMMKTVILPLKKWKADEIRGVSDEPIHVAIYLASDVEYV